MNPFSSRGRLGWWLLILCAVLPAAGLPQEQEQEQRPFIHPSELPDRARAEAMREAHPEQTGTWTTLPFTMPINPVHVALMRNGKVLIVSGSGNDPDNRNFQAAVWDPTGLTIRTFNTPFDMFCNGMVVLPDGRPFILGGTLKYDPFLGESRASVFDPTTERFLDLRRMHGGRWYPTGTVLASGAVLVYSGLNDTTGRTNRTVEIWTGRGWKPAGTAFAGVPLYPREHLLPNGKVFVSGSHRDSRIYDPAARRFRTVATTLFDRDRIYGTSVLLPLTPASGFTPRVMILGGANPATDTTELIDLSVASPRWVAGPTMSAGRIQLNATLLPSGNVLVSGGSVNDDTATAVKEAQLFDPESNRFRSAGTMAFPRLYHSNTLLLPDATVVALGSNPQRKVYQADMEIYVPAYLFNADGSPARRPVITDAPAGARYGGTFAVRTPDVAAITSIVLVRAGAVTHAFDMEQRLVGLSFTVEAGVLKVKAPANPSLAPPGYYLLFLVNSAGVPSLAPFVRLS